MRIAAQGSRTPFASPDGEQQGGWGGPAPPASCSMRRGAASRGLLRHRMVEGLVEGPPCGGVSSPSSGPPLGQVVPWRWPPGGTAGCTPVGTMGYIVRLERRGGRCSSGDRPSRVGVWWTCLWGSLTRPGMVCPSRAKCAVAGGPPPGWARGGRTPGLVRGLGLGAWWRTWVALGRPGRCWLVPGNR